jgi:hypothetical protein
MTAATALFPGQGPGRCFLSFVSKRRSRRPLAQDLVVDLLDPMPCPWHHRLLGRPRNTLRVETQCDAIVWKGQPPV